MVEEREENVRLDGHGNPRLGGDQAAATMNSTSGFVQWLAKAIRRWCPWGGVDVDVDRGAVGTAGSVLHGGDGEKG